MRPRRSRQPRFNHGFRGFPTRIQLRADVFGTRTGVDAGRCDGLEWAGRSIAVHSDLVRVGDLGADGRVVVGAVVSGDGSRSHALSGVDERDRWTG